MTKRIPPFDILASIWVLYALGVAQPMLDLLGRNAEFFLARSSPPLDIIIVGLGVAIAVPTLIAVAIMAIQELHGPTGRRLHFIVLTLLAGQLALQVIERTPLEMLPGAVEMAMSLVIGAVVAVGILQLELLRTAVRFASIAPLVVAGLFLFGSSVSQLVTGSPALAQPSEVTVTDPAPIVMIIFDEFPVASLMDGDGNLQEEVYPNFARLAEEGTWFRNAITVQQQTERSVPAILTGIDPGETSALPMVNDYPANLFTLLADAYEIHAIEAVTQMCPEYACENTGRTRVPFGQRIDSLVDDIRVISGHLYLPEDLTRGLPPIDETWTNFGGGETVDEADFDIIARFNEKVDEDRRVPIAQLIAAIEPASAEPDLYYLHALLPHIPWTYLPTGQTFPSVSPIPGSVPRGWTGDEWLVDQAYQLHLIQVQYVDTIIGELIDRLEEQGIYDDSLIILLADHGVTVRPNIPHRRIANEETLGDIAAVPLFIKQPNQERGGPDDYRAETVDVLPTIADVIGVDIPWAVEGTSLFAEDRPVRTQSQITGDEGVFVFGVDGSEARAVAARKIQHFGPDGPFGLAPPGYAELLGVPLGDLSTTASEDVSATIRDLDGFAAVDLTGPSLPARISGTIRGVDEGVGNELIIAVAINGEVAAVTRSFISDQSDLIEYAAMIPPSSFRDGSNDVGIYLVGGDEGSRSLSLIASS